MVKLAKKVLTEKGLQLGREPYKGMVGPKRVIVDPRKTGLMLQIEINLGVTIEALLSSDDPQREIADRLSINCSTVTKWRQKLGISTPHSANNRDGKGLSRKQLMRLSQQV